MLEIVQKHHDMLNHWICRRRFANVLENRELSPTSGRGFGCHHFQSNVA
jgi:hypothetical protein